MELAELRKKAKQDFDSFELPQEREEAWRYTNLEKLGLELRASDESSVSIESDKDVAMPMMVAMKKHPDLVKKHLFSLITTNDKLSAFHIANFTDGVFVYVPKNTKAQVNITLENPNAHTVIITEPGSELDYTEEITGSSDLITDSTEIFAGPDSRINFSSIQSLSKSKGFSVKRSQLQANAQLNQTFFSHGSSFYRLDNATSFEGEGSEANTLLAFLSRNDSHYDFTSNAYHKVPHTTNNIFAKGVLLDSSNAVFRGLISIAREAQQSNSYLSDHMLMVGEKSLANSIPALEIVANDVKASHGSTKGQIDEDQLFYLESRGLSRPESEKLIIQGFLTPVLEKITNLNVRKKVALSLGVEE